MIDARLERQLELLRELSDKLARDVEGLSPAAWNGPTNCAPWRVRDLTTHVVSSGEGFVRNIRRGLAGLVEPEADEPGRRQRSAELESADPEMAARDLRLVTAEFVGIYRGLQEEQLETVCFHRRGNRSVRWYAAHRLAEVAFHSWDFYFSLDRGPELDEEVAALLLPTLLESNAPRTYAAGLSAQRGTGERYSFNVVDDASARWLVTIDPNRLEATRGGGPADLAISGSAAELALLVYGRRELPRAVRQGLLQLDGDHSLVDRFALVFPRP